MAVQVLIGLSLFEHMYQRFIRMDELSPVLSLVIGYWESSVVRPVYDRDHQGFQKIRSVNISEAEI